MDLITVEQFREMPGSGEFTYELEFGEVVATKRFVQLYYKFDLRAAHVAFVSGDR